MICYFDLLALGVVVSVMLYPRILYVTLLVYLFALCVASLSIFDETIRNMYWYGAYFVVECYGCV